DGMADNAGCQASAAVRQRRDGIVVVAKEGIAAEDAMPFPDILVAPEIGLVLLIGFRCGADEIVSPGDVRQRVMLQNLVGDGVEAGGGTRIIWKRRARRR